MISPTIFMRPRSAPKSDFGRSRWGTSRATGVPRFCDDYFAAIVGHLVHELKALGLEL